ncbi:MAG: Hsp20/alpha crystallin family protein [Gaiellaceae bacterium]
MARRRDIDRLQSEIEELFSDLWQVPRLTGARRSFRPAVDAYYCAEPPCVTVVVELAGVEPEDVQIDAAPRALVVRGVRRRPRVPGRYQAMELDYGPFERTIHVAEDVDVENATATYRNGLLTIVLPLAEKAQSPVNVPIEVQAE